MFIGNMQYYKIQFGYNEADYLEIDESELPKAIALFMEGSGRALFESGAVRGQDIIRITPDWHTDQGWHKGWKMQPEDYQAIEGREESYNEVYNQAREVAEYAIKENKRELLNLPFQIALNKLPAKNPEISEAAKKLTDKFSINEQKN